jgi:hypothetical protein
LLEALLGLSQLEILRGSFAVDIPIPITKTNSSSNAVAEIIMVMKAHSNENDNDDGINSVGLAILMNASLEEAQTVRKAIFSNGGLDIALSGLSAIAGKGKKVDTTSVLVRKAGLLSRLASLEEAQQKLTDPVAFRLLCRGLKYEHHQPQQSNGINNDNNNDNNNNWKVEERGHLIRVLASLTKPNEQCRKIALEENMIESLLATLPVPRMELHEVTPTSVILPPHEPMSPLVVGNTARCLMQYADDASCAKIIFCEGRLLGIEKLICAMATCTDIRVRKNIAILLAKGCRLPGVRDKVSHLRGLQMIVELQDKL